MEKSYREFESPRGHQFFNVIFSRSFEMASDVTKQRIATGLKWGVGFVAAVLVSPFVFMAVQGIVGLAVAIGLGVVIINMAPWFSMKVTNLKLKAIKMEAMTNPIETMQAVYLEQQKGQVEFLKTIESFAGKILNFTDRMITFKSKYPEESAKFQATLTAMNDLLAHKRKKYREAAAELASFAQEITKGNAIWEMSIAAQEMTDAAGMTEKDFMQKLKVETSIYAVQDRLNRAMAALETAVLQELPTNHAEMANTLAIEDKSLVSNAVPTYIPAGEKVR